MIERPADKPRQDSTWRATWRIQSGGLPLRVRHLSTGCECFQKRDYGGALLIEQGDLYGEVPASIPDLQDVERMAIGLAYSGHAKRRVSARAGGVPVTFNRKARKSSSPGAASRAIRWRSSGFR